MEKGHGTIEDYVEGDLKKKIGDIGNINILRQACNGLKWLHSKKISE